MVTRAARSREFALKERLPVVSGWAQFAEAGFLATYGPNLTDAFRHLADYVDRILKGARAGTLPVELPTRVELAVNLTTAKALGLAVPQSVFCGRTGDSVIVRMHRVRRARRTRQCLTRATTGESHGQGLLDRSCRYH